MDLLDSLTTSIQQAGLRLTPQRMAILELLAQSREHPTAQAVYEELRPRFPSLSLATVYNTLETLVELGVVNALGTAGDGAVHYDANTSPHVNLACVACHRVIDFPSQHVPALDDDVSMNSGYQILGARVLYYGLCPECAAKVEEEE